MADIEDKDLSAMVDTIDAQFKALVVRYGDSPESIAKICHAILQSAQNFADAHRKPGLLDKLDSYL